MKKFCPVCGTEKETEVIEKEEISNIRGDEIRTVSKIRVCSECREELFDELLDEENIKRAYDAYRKKNDILSPEDIKSIRELYGLSQKAFAKILNIGEASIARYETGALPEKSLSNMIMLLKEPENMQRLLDKNQSALTYREKTRLIQKMPHMADDYKAIKISEGLYKIIEDKAKKEGKSADRFVEELLTKVV